jgi:lipopolysaccharide biosynthesis glycosyltransferase
MVYSALLNCSKKNFRFVVANVNGMLSDGSTSFINEFANYLDLDIQIVRIDTELQAVFEHHFNLTVYARLFLMDLMEEDFLWLDADLLLMPGWDNIFLEVGDFETSDTVIYGVVDAKRTREKLEKKGNLALLRSGDRYVNSGVLKIRTGNWKKLKATHFWQDMAQNPSKYNFTLMDQDIINYLCSGKVSLLQSGFNQIVGNLVDVQQRIFVKHYAGPPKPWKLDKIGKELFLGIQGAQYFSPRNWIAQYSDAFVDYPVYWEIEEKTIKFLRDRNSSLGTFAEQLRLQTIMNLNRRSKFKHVVMKIVTSKIFS